MKGQAGVLDDVRVDVALRQEWVSHHPFGAPELRSSFTPPGSRSETGTGQLSRRSTIRGPRPPRMPSTPRGRVHSSPTSWEPRCGHTSPNRFCFTLPGFRVEELPAQREDGKALRRLRVEWPEYLASHSSKQTLYFDDADRPARHDYQVEIIAGASAAHLFDGFVSVDGITLPTRHRVHPRDAADRIDTSNVIVAIDVDDITFGQI